MFDYPTVEYQSDPFPHAVIHNAWNDELLIDCKREITEFTDWCGEKNFHGSRLKRYCDDPDRLPFAVSLLIQEASSPKFLRWLSSLTGIPHLIPDPYLHGGGIHSIKSGGFLGIHTDFNHHEELDCWRRLNLLVYLNEWNDEWGGALELWKDGKRAKTIFPHRNTMAIFTTDDDSFHGHPHPLRCPHNESRDSVALYYYTAKAPDSGFDSLRPSTNYATSRKCTK